MDAALAAAIDALRVAVEGYVDALRTAVLPALVQILRANVFRVAVCPACGRFYGVSMADARAVGCCGRVLPADLVEVPRGRMVYLAHPDQCADEPAVVVVGAEEPRRE